MKRQNLEKAEIDAQKIAKTVKSMLPEGWEIILTLCSVGENPLSTYISTIDRSCAPSILRELADQIEQRGFKFDV